MPVTSTRTTSTIAVNLGGASVGDVRAFEGLAMAADIVETSPAGGAVKKHVANFRWTPALMTLGLGMGKLMAEWLRASLKGPAVAASGSVVVGDASYRAKSALDFSDAVLTRLTVPTLDAASKEAVTLLVGFEAERVKITKGDGSDIRTKAPKTKASVSSNFKVEIGGLPCTRVVRVEALSWTRAVAVESLGIFREPSASPAKATVPDLQLTISAVDFDAWAEAARAWFVDGKNLESDEMAGRIVLLAPDLKTELAVITFANVGFRHFQTIASTGGTTGSVSRFAVTLYAEAMSLEVKG